MEGREESRRTRQQLNGMEWRGGEWGRSTSGETRSGGKPKGWKTQGREKARGAGALRVHNCGRVQQQRVHNRASGRGEEMVRSKEGVQCDTGWVVHTTGGESERGSAGSREQTRAPRSHSPAAKFPTHSN